MRIPFMMLSLVAMFNLLVPAVHARSGNDGTWMVTMTTQKGDCEPSLHSSIFVNNGRIDQQGLFANISGGIDESGNVALQVSRGSDKIAARGTAAGRQGRGVWNSPSRNCAGTWIAMRS